LLCAYGALSAFFFPRIFSGLTEINAIGATEYGPSVMLTPLAPVGGNVSQTIYLLADLCVFIIVDVYCRGEAEIRTVVKAMILFSVGNILFAFLDLLTFYTNTSYMLDFIRNAQYAFHVDEVTSGLKRIAGSFTETSSFSYATIGAFSFNSSMFICGRWPRLTGSISIISLVLLILSTSSTAIASLPAVASMLYILALFRILATPGRSTVLISAIIAPLFLFCLFLALALNDDAVAYAQDIINVTLIDKSSSQSGLERASWNVAAFNNFVDTYGLGAGLGSVRASSFVMAVLGNIGFVGFFVFVIFLLLTLFPRVPADLFVRDVNTSSRVACLSLLVAATVSGSLVDLGLTFYVFVALAYTGAAGGRF
jgi:hypothetical protein